MGQTSLAGQTFEEGEFPPLLERLARETRVKLADSPCKFIFSVLTTVYLVPQLSSLARRKSLLLCMFAAIRRPRIALVHDVAAPSTNGHSTTWTVARISSY